MTLFHTFTRSIFICVAISCLSPNLANAKDYKIGSVKRIFNAGGCGTYLPGTEKAMLLVDEPNSNASWINIDGKDIRLKWVNTKVIKSRKKRIIIKFQSQNLFVTVDSRDVSTFPGGSTTRDQILINYQGQTKKIIATGFCAQ